MLWRFNNWLSLRYKKKEKSMKFWKIEVMKWSQSDLIFINSVVKYLCRVFINILRRYWENHIRIGIIGVFFNIWGWFISREKGWIWLIGGVYSLPWWFWRYGTPCCWTICEGCHWSIIHQILAHQQPINNKYQENRSSTGRLIIDTP